MFYLDFQSELISPTPAPCNKKFILLPLSSDFFHSSWLVDYSSPLTALIQPQTKMLYFDFQSEKPSQTTPLRQKQKIIFRLNDFTKLIVMVKALFQPPFLLII
jgi:hypothetical protein